MAYPIRFPAKPTDKDRLAVYAIRALRDGAASPHQQKVALDYIVNEIAQTYYPEFDADSERLSAFKSGRRGVGLMIVEMLNSPAIIKAIQTKNPPEAEGNE